MILKDNAVVKNIARLIGVKSKKGKDNKSRPALIIASNKINEKTGHKYSTDTIGNILSAGWKYGPDKIFRFRFAHSYDIDNPEDLDVPEDFIKLEKIIYVSNLPDEKKEALKMVLQINDPGRFRKVFDAIKGHHDIERKEFKAEVERKIEEYKDLSESKELSPDKIENRGTEEECLD